MIRMCIYCGVTTVSSFFPLATLRGIWDLGSQPGIQPCALEAWSLNPWTPGKYPLQQFSQHASPHVVTIFLFCVYWNF